MTRDIKELKLALCNSESHFGKIDLAPGLKMSKEVHFLLGPGNGIFAGSQEERNSQKCPGTTGEV